MNTIKQWMCPRCKTWHYNTVEASCCCDSYLESRTKFVCDKCGEDWALEEDAEQCCIERGV